MPRDNSEYFGGPNRWDGHGEQEGHAYNSAKWFGDAARGRMELLRRLYDEPVVACPEQTAVTLRQCISGAPPQLLPEQSMLEWLMFVDSWTYGQELRMAIQDGPWEWVDAEVRRLLAVSGLTTLYRSRACLSS